MAFRNFGQYLKFLRKKARDKQGVLSTELGCSLQTISNWETGRYLPARREINRIADALKLLPARRRKLELLHAAARWKRQLKHLEPLRLKAHQEKLIKQRFLDELSIPLFSAKDTLDPAKVLLHRRTWKGTIVYKTPDLRDRCFGFLVQDVAMNPRFEPGDLLICSLRRPAPGKPAVLRLSSRTVCRIFQPAGRQFLLRALHKKVRPIKIRGERVKWAYRVERMMRIEPV